MNLANLVMTCNQTKYTKRHNYSFGKGTFGPQCSSTFYLSVTDESYVDVLHYKPDTFDNYYHRL